MQIMYAVPVVMNTLLSAFIASVYESSRLQICIRSLLFFNSFGTSFCNIMCFSDVANLCSPYYEFKVCARTIVSLIR
jgi:hypothetical protein